jgi:hypothetical protein
MSVIMVIVRIGTPGRYFAFPSALAVGSWKESRR